MLRTSRPRQNKADEWESLAPVGEGGWVEEARDREARQGVATGRRPERSLGWVVGTSIPQQSLVGGAAVRAQLVHGWQLCDRRTGTRPQRAEREVTSSSGGRPEPPPRNASLVAAKRSQERAEELCGSATPVQSALGLGDQWHAATPTTQSNHRNNYPNLTTIGISTQEKSSSAGLCSQPPGPVGS